MADVEKGLVKEKDQRNNTTTKWVNFLYILLILILILLIFANGQLKDKYPNHSAAVSISLRHSPIQAGFAAIPITPELMDRWTDVDGNAQFNPNIDEFQDVNGNGCFDAIWLAGFHKSRAATAVHDELLASAAVIQVGTQKIGLVSLDVIGLGNDITVPVQEQLKAELGLAHCFIVSTHNHEGPDVIGIWGNSDYKSGVAKGYKEKIQRGIVQAVSLADQARQPALVKYNRDTIAGRRLMLDSRLPYLLDDVINCMQFVNIEREHLGMLVGWGNHVETLWDKNTEISSDFVHYLRESIQEGVADSTEVLIPAYGGVTLFLPGAVGGLMSTPPELSIRDPLTKAIYTKPSFDKIKAQGRTLALKVHEALELEKDFHSTTEFQCLVEDITLPLDNSLFRLGALIGVMDRGLNGWMTVRSEVAFWQMGPFSLIHVPGELYPEIAFGGIETPEGQDFPESSIEYPTLAQAIPTKWPWIVGLSNDMIGYIIPKSQWDEKAPYTYGAQKKPYGELMSLGPETGPKIHGALLTLLSRAEP